MNKETASILLIVLILVAIFGFGMYWLLKQTPAPIEEQSALNLQPNPNLTNQEPAPLEEQKEQQKNMSNLVTIKTSMGEIEIETYDSDAPKTAKNFKDLAQKGYYDGLIFHRVIKGFMIQGGDPLCGATQDKGQCGTGGPGYQFEDELNSATASYKTGYKKGVVAMANSGPNTNGSQFFIMHADYGLPNNYTIFGKVVKGQDVVDKIANTKVGAGDRPTTAVVMEKVTVK
jgi:cyclophilin family peptidyl-prolyl cis-trans isomerase